MWIFILFLFIGPLDCTDSPCPPDPTDVYFNSVNLRNVLEWVPGNGTPHDTHYSVQYAIYGDSFETSRGRRVNWRSVWHCTEIVRNWCDLTNETWDLEHGYHAKVRAVTKKALCKWSMTWRRFDPKVDTDLGPPLISVEIEDNNNAIISLSGPMRYQPDRHKPAVSMAKIYPQMTYSLYIQKNQHDQVNHFPDVSSPYKYRLMEYNSEYCFSAKIKLPSMPVKSQQSEWYCITTPPDPLTSHLQLVIVGIVVPSLCMCMTLVVGYLLYHFLSGKGQESPRSLNPSSFQPLTFYPNNLNIPSIPFFKVPSLDPDILYVPTPKQPPNTNSPPPYFAQRPEMLPEQEERLYDSSVDYGVISKVKTNNGGKEEEGQWRQDRRVEGNMPGGDRKIWPVMEIDRKEQRTENHPPASYFPQKSTPTCSQKLVPEVVSTLVQTKSDLTPTQAPVQSLISARKGEVDGDLPGIFLKKNPLTGFFHIPLNLKTKVEGEMERRETGETDEEVEEKNECQKIPPLSAYASQNIIDKTVLYARQSGPVSDDYGIMLGGETHREEDEEEEDGQSICINWDPESQTLTVPKIPFNMQGGWNGLGMRGAEDRVKCKKADLLKRKLKLENVFVRQASEEEGDAKRQPETALDEILTKWDLVVSMDQ
ncbi:interleukin-20 receptor subunit alpha [Aulostomus maculatus]